MDSEYDGHDNVWCPEMVELHAWDVEASRIETHVHMCERGHHHDGQHACRCGAKWDSMEVPC